MVKVECTGCGCEFEIETNRFNDRLRKNGSDEVFCSSQCHERWQSDSFRHRRQRIIDKERERNGDTKTCSKCGMSFPLEKFYSKGNRLRNECSVCFSRYISDCHLAKKLALIEFLGGSCQRCHRTCHPAAYHFHHTDPSTKEFDWNRLQRRSIKNILREIQKCVLICGECHAIEHGASTASAEVTRMKDIYLLQLRELSK